MIENKKIGANISLFKHKAEKSVLYESDIYKRIDNWMDDNDQLKIVKKDIKMASGDYKIELIKRYRKMDFFRTFITICRIATQSIMVDSESKTMIRNIVGSVMGRLLFETANIEEINDTFKILIKDSNLEFTKWLNNRRIGEVWITNTFLDEKIESLFDEVYKEKERKIGDDIGEKEWDLTFIDYAKFEFALISGSSYTDVEAMMSRGISRTSLCNILYSFIMIRRLMETLGDDLLLNWYGDEDRFSGHSGISHYFDGIITLDDDGDIDNPWLFKCVSMCHNPLQSIESIKSKMDDVGVRKCILFLPMYPSQNAWRYAVHIYATQRYEVMMLYLHDLYNILKIDNLLVKDYLRGKRI